MQKPRQRIVKRPAARGISLIGLPGSGKSTVGSWLSEQTGMDLLDTDRWIEKQHGKPLRVIEEEILLSEEDRALKNNILSGKVIATSGSVVYGSSLDYLQTTTRIFYLQRELSEVEPYLSGRVILGGREALPNRVPFYEEWAENTIVCRGKSVEEIGWEIIEKHRAVWHI